MTELKTLKDIPPANETDRNKFSTRQGITKLYCEEDLKKSAIEWIKAIEKGFNSEELHIDCNGNKGILSWIKYIYNITEEDLMEATK